MTLGRRWNTHEHYVVTVSPSHITTIFTPIIQKWHWYRYRGWPKKQKKVRVHTCLGWHCEACTMLRFLPLPIDACRAQDCTGLCCAVGTNALSTADFEDLQKWNTTLSADQTPLSHQRRIAEPRKERSISVVLTGGLGRELFFPAVEYDHNEAKQVPIPPNAYIPKLKEVFTSE